MANFNTLAEVTGTDRHDETVSAGTTSDPLHIQAGQRPTIVVDPVSGGSALVEVSMSSFSAIEASSATWEDWDMGTVSIRTSRLVNGEIRALRCTATTQNCVFSVVV